MAEGKTIHRRFMASAGRQRLPESGRTGNSGGRRLQLLLGYAKPATGSNRNRTACMALPVLPLAGQTERMHDSSSLVPNPFGLQTTAEREMALLAPYAFASGQSRGRKHPEPAHAYRGPFQRDRDRILHASAFRRLSGKMQVF